MRQPVRVGPVGWSPSFARERRNRPLASSQSCRRGRAIRARTASARSGRLSRIRRSKTGWTAGSSDRGKRLAVDAPDPFARCSTSGMVRSLRPKMIGAIHTPTAGLEHHIHARRAGEDAWPGRDGTAGAGHEPGRVHRVAAARDGPSQHLTRRSAPGVPGGDRSAVVEQCDRRVVLIEQGSASSSSTVVCGSRTRPCRQPTIAVSEGSIAVSEGSMSVSTPVRPGPRSLSW